VLYDYCARSVWWLQCWWRSRLPSGSLCRKHDGLHSRKVHWHVRFWGHLLPLITQSPVSLPTNKVKQSSLSHRPWSLIGFWGVEDPTLYRHSAHRWCWGCQPYAPAVALLHRNMRIALLCSRYSFLLETEQTPGPSAAGRMMSIDKNKSPHPVSNSQPSGL
jgi:hypothetical protein